MDNVLKNLLSKLLRESAEKLDSGSCSMSDEELMSSLTLLTKFDSNQQMSKEQACMYLNMSRSQFDFYVRSGNIPKGEKRLGFKEKVWYRKDLVKFVYEQDRL